MIRYVWPLAIVLALAACGGGGGGGMVPEADPQPPVMEKPKPPAPSADDEAPKTPEPPVPEETKPPAPPADDEPPVPEETKPPAPPEDPPAPVEPKDPAPVEEETPAPQPMEKPKPPVLEETPEPVEPEPVSPPREPASPPRSPSPPPEDTVEVMLPPEDPVEMPEVPVAQNPSWRTAYPLGTSETYRNYGMWAVEGMSAASHSFSFGMSPYNDVNYFAILNYELIGRHENLEPNAPSGDLTWSGPARGWVTGSVPMRSRVEGRVAASFSLERNMDSIGAMTVRLHGLNAHAHGPLADVSVAGMTVQNDGSFTSSEIWGTITGREHQGVAGLAQFTGTVVGQDDRPRVNMIFSGSR